MTEQLEREVDGCVEVSPARLEWYAFLSRCFPNRRRHDHQALKAYEAYRSKAVPPRALLFTAVATSAASGNGGSP